jgi:hypothetical protein
MNKEAVEAASVAIWQNDQLFWRMACVLGILAEHWPRTFCRALAIGFEGIDPVIV